MAKENKNNQPVVITAENVIEERQKGNVLTPELRAKMDAEVKEANDKKVIAEVKARTTKIGYMVDLGLVEQRNSKELSKMAGYNTRQLGRLQRFLTGFVVTEQIVTEFAKTKDNVLELEKLDNEKNPKALIIMVPAADGKREEKTFKVGDTVPAIIDYNEFDDGLIKLKKNLEEMESEARKKYNKELIIIQKAAGEYWREDWRWNMRVVTANGLRDRSSY